MTEAEKQVVEAAVVWRAARCKTQAPPAGTTIDGCVGDNHIEDCPCEYARQDLIAAVNAYLISPPR